MKRKVFSQETNPISATGREIWRWDNKLLGKKNSISPPGKGLDGK